MSARLKFARAINGIRLRVGAWILGNGWHGVVMRLWLIRERAMQAVGEDGRVMLAECEPLAEILYAPIPGRWTLTVTRVDPASLSSSSVDTGNDK